MKEVVMKMTFKKARLMKSVTLLLTLVVLIGCTVVTKVEAVAQSSKTKGLFQEGQQGRLPMGRPPVGTHPQGMPPHGDIMQSHPQDSQIKNPGKPGGEGSSLSIEEANAIEEQLINVVDTSALEGNYPIADTGLESFYSNKSSINERIEGKRFYGQDANYTTKVMSYTDNGDGTVKDNVTGLIWIQDPGEKMTWIEAVEMLEEFEFNGHSDWRLPTIKELYSLIDFSGKTESKPYINEEYFTFTYGDETGERTIDSQYATSTIYDSDTMDGNTTMFGVNFADGRIKGYPIDKEFYVMLVRGNEYYGINNFVDNRDGTITDLATGLMWLTNDSGHFLGEEGAMDWDDALDWAENLDYAGYDDWKLPDAKELHSVVDYTRTPDTTNSAAINDLFNVTEIEALNGAIDYPFYWTSTTHLDGLVDGENAVYIAFGEALGEMDGEIVDVHGAGAQRSDPKTGKEADYPKSGNGPQGDVQAVFNYVRAVRVVN